MKRSSLRKKLKGAVILLKTEKVSLGKVKYDSLTGKSVIHSTISQFDPYMNKRLVINN